MVLQRIQRTAESLCEFLQNNDGHFHIGFSQRCQKVPAGEGEAFRRLGRDDRSSAQAVIKQGKFPKKIGRAECVDRDLVTLGTLAEGLSFACYYDKESLTAPALSDNRLSTIIRTLDHTLGQVFELAVVQALKQGYFLQKTNCLFEIAHVLALSGGLIEMLNSQEITARLINY